MHDFTGTLSTAFSQREDDLRELLTELDTFMGNLNHQSGDIIAANESLNRLVGQFADEKPIVDAALAAIPDALTELGGVRENLTEALARLGRFGELAGYLSFNLNVNLPPICATGYLPAQQRRAPSEIDYPVRPGDGHLHRSGWAPIQSGRSGPGGATADLAVDVGAAGSLR